jgi:hypothetical protein
MQQNKPQSSLTSNVSTEFSKTRNAVHVCLTQLWKICAMYHKEMLNIVIAKIPADIASCVSHIHYTSHEHEQRRQ